MNPGLEEEEILVSNQGWIKFTLITGFVLFVIACLWAIYLTGFGSFRLGGGRWAFASVSFFFGWLSYVIWGLLPYLNHKLCIKGDQLQIISPNSMITLPAGMAMIKVRNALQIIEIYSSNDELLYSVDFLATNAFQLRNLASRAQSPEP